MLRLKTLGAGIGLSVVSCFILYFVGMSKGYKRGIKIERGIWSERVLGGELLKKEKHNELIEEVNTYNETLQKELVNERQKNTSLNSEFRNERKQYLARISQLAGKVGDYVTNECQEDGTFGFSREFIDGVFNSIARGAGDPTRRRTDETTQEDQTPSTPTTIGIRPIVSAHTPDRPAAQ